MKSRLNIVKVIILIITTLSILFYPVLIIIAVLSLNKIKIHQKIYKAIQTWYNKEQSIETKYKSIRKLKSNQ
jgi:hypothetical protein